MTINNKFTCRAYLGSQKVKTKDHRVLFDVNTPARCSIKVEAFTESEYYRCGRYRLG